MSRSARPAFVGAIFFLLVMIFDSKTALSGAVEGVQLCVATVIPTLFPFIFVCNVLTATLSAQALPFPRRLCKIFGIPNGAQGLVLMGFLGGYPVGAQCIGQARQSGTLNRTDAEHLLSFCNNAGPAFLFGLGMTVLGSVRLCALVWLIHIVSALIVGCVHAKGEMRAMRAPVTNEVDFSAAMIGAVRAMALVCGWIVLFRTGLAFCELWFLWLLPRNLRLLLTGMAELTNGCCALTQIDSLGLRMRLFCGMIGFGGVCVGLQTKSVLRANGLHGSAYFPGKAAQAAISYLLSLPVQFFLPASERDLPSMLFPSIAVATVVGYVICQRKARKKTGNCVALAL